MCLDLVECKRRLCDRELSKQFEKVFQLFDIHSCGFVDRSDVAFNLISIKDNVSAEVNLSLVPDIENF